VNANLERELAPPGAGLPQVELLVARLLFAFQRRLGNRNTFNARFQRERESIRALVSSCTEISGAQRVLICRAAGMEDSSRHWSVWMTLDHLRIVHQGMIRVIGALTKGVKPPGAASTANVKPSPQATSAVLLEYEKSCDELLATVASAPQLKTVLRYTHPWFGPLDASGWHALAASHIGIHRVQIERVLQGVTTAP